MPKYFSNISISIPQNIKEQYRGLYQQRSTYPCPKLQVRKVQNVFVSHEGLCWKNFRLLPYSTFNINSSYDAKHGWEFYKLATEQYLVSTFGKSLKKINLSPNTTYGIIHTKWFNYSFWVTSSLVRLQMLINSGVDFTLLYPEEWDKIPYIQQTLQAYPNLKFERIPAGVHVQVPHLLMPEVRPFTACLNGNDLQMVSTKLKSFFNISKQPKSPKRIFVNRQKANCRKMENGNAIVHIANKYGFTEVDFDDMTVAQQIDAINNAECVIMLHGAGMANMMFAQPGTRVLELMHEYTEPRNYRMIYWYLTELSQAKYYVQFCKTIPTHSDEWRKNIVVDVAHFEQNIKLMLR